MAPRGRPSKRGESRMDAALDAMAPYGFPNKLVRQTVSQLLKVYGGNDGWVFIEDSAYTLLIDTLLEKQQPVHPLPHPQDCLIEDNPENYTDEALPTGCSNTAVQPYSNAEASGDVPSTNQALDTITTTRGTGNQLPIISVDTTSPTSKTVNELLPINPIGNGTSAATKTVNELLPIKPTGISTETGVPSDQPSIKAVETVLATCKSDHQVPIRAVDIVSTNNESESPQTRISQPLRRPCHKRRKPCHGWISNDHDDDEEEKLIELPPARLSNALLVNGGAQLV